LDPFHDLAVLHADVSIDAKPLLLGPGEPPIGTPVFALGNPQGLERTISEGIVSGTRILGGRNLLQITAAISPGSSGGPGLGRDGAVIGVTVGAIESGQSLNFAIPAPAVRALLRESPAAGAFSVAIDAARQLATDNNRASRPARAVDALRGAAALATTGSQFL